MDIWGRHAIAPDAEWLFRASLALISFLSDVVARTEVWMDDLSLPKQAWIVVSDGGKAMLFQNEGTPARLSLRLAEKMTDRNEPARRLGEDRPGRVYQSQGNRRSATDETDWHEAREREFISNLASRLDELVQSKSIGHLVVIAPPKALGILRREVTAPVRAVIRAEVSKDLTHLSTAELEKYLSSAKKG
jgi:protein required for attachment to host cells